jgi:hypothetical protein
MNQDPAHSSRLHHAGVTDVTDARRRIVATRTLNLQGF